MREGKIYKVIASYLEAHANCVERENEEWRKRHRSMLEEIAKDHLPSGCGIDAGCELDFDRSDANKIVISTAFHHMDENGSYDGWTQHVVTIRASLAHDFDISISGRDRNMIKEYLHETFDYELKREIVWDEDRAKFVLKREVKP